MTVVELAKRLQVAISQGGGKNEVCVHQWLHGMQELTAVEVRPDGTLELYSNTVDREDDDPTAGLIDDDDLI